MESSVGFLGARLRAMIDVWFEARGGSKAHAKTFDVLSVRNRDNERRCVAASELRDRNRGAAAAEQSAIVVVQHYHGHDPIAVGRIRRVAQETSNHQPVAVSFMFECEQLKGQIGRRRRSMRRYRFSFRAAGGD
jgi:hypothetical protein